MFVTIQHIWRFCVVSILFIPRILSDQLFNFGLRKDPCEMECQCYNWKSTMNITPTFDRFTVNCTGMKFGLFQGLSIPQPLPINTTDLLVTDYFLGTLSVKSFDNNAFPLNPQLLTLILKSCHITYLSFETFNANSLQSLHQVDLSFNTIEKLHEDTFSLLPKVKSISVANNYIQKVERNTFRNLHEVKVINISHNWLKELGAGVFYRVPKLQVLDLSYNWLETLPWVNMSQVLSLKELGLKGNPWNCSCEMKSILKLNRLLLSGSQAMCQYPQKLNGTLLEELKSDHFSYCFASKKDTKTIEYVHVFTLFIGIILGVLLPVGICPSFSKSFEIRQVKQIGQIRYYINDEISWNVYRGELNDGREAAIKKHVKMTEQGCKELENLLHLSKAQPHPNVIEYLLTESDQEFTYLALKLCDGDLMTAVMEEIPGFLDNISDAQKYFLQLISGICYLHEHNLQHRDIKPQNILWKTTMDGITLVISDLDSSHFTQEKSLHQMFGTTGWIAPELWNLKESRSNAVDIFSLGCVFYFILSKGHPFGEISRLDECQRNILNSEYKVSLDKLCEHFDSSKHLTAMAEHLIRRMICLSASDRIKDSNIMNHPFLLTKVELAKFLDKIGEYMDDEVDPKVQNFKERLKEKSHIVFTGNWRDKLAPRAKSDLTMFKSPGDADNICCLLRAVRNKRVHFHKFKEDLRNIYLNSEFGVIEYYTTLFPKLVTYTFDTLENSEIDDFTF